MWVVKMHSRSMHKKVGLSHKGIEHTRHGIHLRSFVSISRIYFSSCDRPIFYRKEFILLHSNDTAIKPFNNFSFHIG